MHSIFYDVFGARIKFDRQAKNIVVIILGVKGKEVGMIQKTEYTRHCIGLVECNSSSLKPWSIAFTPFLLLFFSLTPSRLNLRQLIRWFIQYRLNFNTFIRSFSQLLTPISDTYIITLRLSRAQFHQIHCTAHSYNFASLNI